MSKGYAAACSEATGHHACEYGGRRTPVRVGDLVSSFARTLWPRKTAPELAHRADVTVRTAEHWLGGRCGLSADALAELICSDAGLDLLEAMMERRGTKPDWWRAFKRQTSIAAARREIDEARRRLEQLERDA